MAHKQYDILILGESLAAQIAAALLARSGRRVLLLQRAAGDTAQRTWVPVSRHLEGVLELLGGRSCLVAPSPFQVITGQSRLTYNGFSPHVDELRREFPDDSDRLNALLKELREIGERLETALWEAGGLPLTGMTSRWRFVLQRLRQRLGARRLRRPLSDQIARCCTESARDALGTLFSGLALSPLEQLTVAEGALLWRSFGESRGVSVSALNELLEHRLEQFHGETAPAETLQSLQIGNLRSSEAVFRNGQRCTAGTILLGSPEMLSFLPSVLQPPAPSPPRPAPVQAEIIGCISPLLAPAILLGGEPTLRLTLTRAAESGCCRVTAEAAPASAPFTPADFRRRLAPLVPFADLQVEPFGTGPLASPAAVRGKRYAFPGAARTIAAAPHLYLCSGQMVLPTLGATGDVLTGVSLASHLQRQKKR